VSVDLRKAKLDSRKFFAAWMKLQTVRLYAPKKMDGKICAVMNLLDEQARRLRRKEIFGAGARCRKLKAGTPKFGGSELGSFETSVFYDGFASTHPGFKSPYRGL
jgi:hypothetical protein